MTPALPPPPDPQYLHAIMDPMIAAEAGMLPRYQLNPGAYSSHSLLLARFPEPGNGRRVLDVGCADGYFSAILAQRGYAVTGIDLPGTPHPASIAFFGIDLDRGLGPVEGRFDYIVCADVIEHLREPARLLAECCRRLAPGGLLFASLPNSGHWYFRGNVLLGRFPKQDNGLFDSTHLHFFTWSGWVALFQAAGFRLLSVRPTAVPCARALAAWGGPFVPALERVSYECARVWKTLFAYQFVVTACVEDRLYGGAAAQSPTPRQAD